MLVVSNKGKTMASPFFFHEFKKQASSFFKDKIKTARLALTDVTPVQLMTEEATNGNSWPPDTRAIGVISRSAFEVDDYCRVVEILHTRLLSFDRKNWRGPYKALILLEHLLTHGPLRVAEEFKDDIDVIEEMESFQYIDEKGFNWGLRVSKLSERVSKLIEDPGFLKEERARARDLTRGIEGFGSFVQRPSPSDSSLIDLPSSKVYGRCNSQYNNRQDEDGFFGIRTRTIKKEHEGAENPKGNHRFCDGENQTEKFLLSSSVD